MDDFTVTFMGSEGCSNLYINHAIDFETHAYEVCMQEIIIQPNSWNNVSKAGGTYIAVYHDVATGREYRAKAMFEIGNVFRSNAELVDAVNDAILIAIKKEIVTTPNAFKSWGDKKIERFIYRTAHNKHELKIAEHNYIVFDPILSYLFGVTSNIHAPSVMLYNDFLFDDSIDVTRFIITMLWVFADFVEPTIMGSQQQPLLGIVPLDITQSDTNYKLIPKMFYYKVQQRKIRNIIISICDNYMGNVLDITKEFITILHFKRVLHYYFPETFPLIVSLKNSESYVTLNSPLNFSEYDYEVCVRDVWVSLEGWPNIRQGSNMLELYNRITNQKTYLYVRPGYYKTRYANLGAIAAPIIESTKYKTFKEVFELSSDKE